MAGTEATADAKKERALRTRCKKYGITPEFYNALGDVQKWCCGICGRPFSEFNTSPNIDHAHFRIDARRYEDGWFAEATFQGGSLATATAKTKEGAIGLARALAMPKSVRGLLCPGRHCKAMHGGCNRLLGSVDNCEWLERADHYLKNTPASQLETKLWELYR